MSYWTQFATLGGFTTILRPDTCLRDMTKTLSFSHFTTVFMSYWTLFWHSRGIYNDPKTQYMFESYDQKLVVFTFYGRFHELLNTVLVLRMDR